jgi:hypothetical protein
MTPGPRIAILEGANQTRERAAVTENQIERTLSHLMATSLAMRDILIVLLANEAGRASDSNEVFKRISNGLNKKISESESAPEIQGEMALVEKIREQVDSIVDAARLLVSQRR